MHERLGIHSIEELSDRSPTSTMEPDDDRSHECTQIGRGVAVCLAIPLFEAQWLEQTNHTALLLMHSVLQV